MAKPKVFISSTYYDLKYVREDIERFVLELGYEPVRHETGNIAYVKDAPLEESAYREASLSDIIVSIIGGRYGTTSATRDGSITQNELREALKQGIQVYIFVEQNVHSEYSTYVVNKDNKDIKYRHVDDVRVYQFLEEIFSLPNNNPVTPFLTSAGITNFLKLQWAGLFQNFLQHERRLTEIEVLNEMSSVASTLKELVKFLTEERSNKDDAIKNILLSNHPAFRAFANVTETKYRVYFSNNDELDSWLSARGWRFDPNTNLDPDSVAEWINENREIYIKLTSKIFDNNGRLIPMTDNEWKDEWVKKQIFHHESDDEPSFSEWIPDDEPPIDWTPNDESPNNEPPDDVIDF